MSWVNMLEVLVPCIVGTVIGSCLYSLADRKLRVRKAKTVLNQRHGRD